VNAVWQEFKYGINGGPSIESLTKMGTCWRTYYKENGIIDLPKKERVRKRLQRRAKIYNAIKIRIENGMTEEEAVEDLENDRVAKGFSVSRLQEHLK
jgi:hypothetical protein